MFRQNVEVMGFGIVPGLFARDEVEALKGELKTTPLRRSRAGARHALRCTAVLKIAQDQRLVGLAQQLLGTDAFPFRARPWSVKGGVTYAHAPAVALEQILALRVHLDDSTEGNGPLRVLPNTHTLGVLSDDAIERLASEIDPVSCIVPKGGVVAMRPLAVHASSKSGVEMPRRVLHIEYASSPIVAENAELAVA